MNDGKTIRRALLTAKNVAAKVDPSFKRIPFADGGVADDTDDSSVFYSGLQDAITNAKQKAAPAQDWKNIIKPGSAPGVTQSELDATGLHGFLDQQQGQVPREALVNHVRGNVPKISDVWKGLETHGGGWDGIEKNKTKYHSYQTPGGEKYKELLMTLPQKMSPISRKDAMYAGKWGQKFKYSVGDQEKEFSGAASEYDALKNLPEDTKFLKSHDSYKSPHWDEPNILAHVRMHDRKGPHGEKLLHIEEMQSDWHQRGRKHGYQSDGPRRRYRVINKHSQNATNWMDSRDKAMEHHKSLPESLRGQTYVQEQLLPKNEHAVPDAPFKDTKEWTALAMKRVMRHAADNGYKGVTWTTGDQQADRYDLSKHLDEVHAERLPDGEFSLMSKLKNGNFEPLEKSVSAEDLPGVVGKELAEKIVSDKSARQKYSGLDLKVGGEGMREYYDKILPSVANRIGKEHGVKHSMIQYPEKKHGLRIESDGQKHVLYDDHEVSDDLGDEPGSPARVGRYSVLGDAENAKRALLGSSGMKLHYMPVTPSMKGKKQKLFKRGGIVTPNVDKAMRVAHKHIRSK